MSDPKTKPTNDSVEDFLGRIDNDRRREDSQRLLKLMEAATQAKPVLWGTSIIGFGKHHYKYESGREGDTVAVGFAPRKNALVIYGIVFYDQNRMEIEDLGPVTAGKGCLYIKSLDSINGEILTKMVAAAFERNNNV